MSTLANIPFERMDGTTAALADWADKVILVVNVASKCGLTPQYEALQRLYESRDADGLVVLGFPANDFAGQEPGTNEEIAEFCSTQYAVSFPVMSKISVVGAEQHPLYRELTHQQPTAAGKEAFREQLKGYGMQPTTDPDVLWNFEKFLIARDGTVAARFAPTTSPEDPSVTEAIDAELAK